MLDKPAVEGLEFVRAWDVGAVSMISLTPLLFSLVFVALWIGVCVGHFGVDVQVATTTAFTVAVFVVTAGMSECLVVIEADLTDGCTRSTCDSAICVLGQSYGEYGRRYGRQV